MSALERVAALTAVQALVKDALSSARDEVQASMREGERRLAYVGEDELAGITYAKGTTAASVTSLADLIDWCRENVPDAVVELRSLTEPARLRAEAAYLKTAAAHEVNTRTQVEPSRLAEFLRDVKAGASIPGITLERGAGKLQVRQSDEQRALVGELWASGVLNPLELEP